MQVKIIIGTIAFMLTMILLGFVALQEPQRLQIFSDAYEGRSIENGAEIFISNCATCHGVNGEARECYNAAGEQIGCAGLPLNNAALLCGTRSDRMEARNWSGSKYDFIESTIAAGRSPSGMPAWSQAFGGPLQTNQVQDVTLFVLNWEDEDLCGAQEEEAGPVWPPQVSELPAPNPDNGPQLYQITYGCQACHGDPAQSGSAAVGPWLGDLGDRVPLEGYTAADYMYESILLPNAHIAEECPNGDCPEPSSMPGNFGQTMALQDMSDIISYVLGVSELESNVEVEYPAGAVSPQAVEEP